MGVQRRDGVDQRDAHLHRRARRLAGDRHEPREALHDGVVAGPLAVRPGRAEAGDRAVDQPGVDGAQRLPAEPEVVHRPGLEVLDQDVAPSGEIEDQRLAPRVLEVDRDAPLASVDREEVRGLAVGRAGRRPLPAVVSALRMLDLDHLGAVVAEDLGRERSRDDTREVDDPEVFERPGHASPPRGWRCHYTRRPRPLQRDGRSGRPGDRVRGARGARKFAEGARTPYTPQPERCVSVSLCLAVLVFAAGLQRRLDRPDTARPAARGDHPRGSRPRQGTADRSRRRAGRGADPHPREPAAGAAPRPRARGAREGRGRQAGPRGGPPDQQPGRHGDRVGHPLSRDHAVQGAPQGPGGGVHPGRRRLGRILRGARGRSDPGPSDDGDRLDRRADADGQRRRPPREDRRQRQLRQVRRVQGHGQPVPEPPARGARALPGPDRPVLRTVRGAGRPLAEARRGPGPRLRRRPHLHGQPGAGPRAHRPGRLSRGRDRRGAERRRAHARPAWSPITGPASTARRSTPRRRPRRRPPGSPTSLASSSPGPASSISGGPEPTSQPDDGRTPARRARNGSQSLSARRVWDRVLPLPDLGHDDSRPIGKEGCQ